MLTVAACAALWAHAVVGALLVHTLPTSLTQLLQPHPCTERGVRHTLPPPRPQHTQHHLIPLLPPVTKVPPPPSGCHTSLYTAQFSSPAHTCLLLPPAQPDCRHHPSGLMGANTHTLLSCHPVTLSRTPHPAHVCCHSPIGLTLAGSTCTHALPGCTHQPLAPAHPSGPPPVCRAGFGCHRGCRSTPEDRGSRKRPPSGHSDPRSDKAQGCTSLPVSAREAHSLSTQRPPEITPQILPQGAQQAPCPGSHTGPSPRTPLQTLPPKTHLPVIPPHLTLSASEALRTGADEARVGGRADTPVQTGPGEAGVGLLLAVRASVARAA